MKLYHAPSQRIEELPPDRGPVKLYALGLAAYPVMGLRQAVIYTVVDCFIRYLHFQGRPVTYFQDTTHLDDTIGRHAAQTGADEFALRRAWAVHLLADMQALNLHPPADCLLATKGAQPAVEVVLRNTAAVGFRLQIPLATSRAVRPTRNAVALCELLACYSPNVLRFFLASHRYWQSWEYSAPALARAAEHVRLLEQAATVRSGRGLRYEPMQISRYVIAALDEDLNTASALTALLFFAEEILRAAAAGQQVKEAQSILCALGRIFGISLGATEAPRGGGAKSARGRAAAARKAVTTP